MPTVAEAMSAALSHHQAGRLGEAEQLYRQILAVDPNHAVAWHLLGVIASQLGCNDAAEKCIGRALELQPNYAEARNNLGLAYSAQGKLDEAAACYQRAIELKPDYYEAHYNLALAMRRKGLRDQEIAHLRRALELKPDSADVYNDLGNTYIRLGRLDEAIACYRRLLELQPQQAEAHHNLGGARFAQGKYEEAVASYRRALELKPDLPETLNGLATAYALLDDPDHAVACYRRAIELKPNYAEALNNLGNALKDQAKLDESLACYRQAIELDPAFDSARNNLLYAMSFCPGVDAAAIYEEHRRWNEQYARPLARFIAPHTNDRSPERRLRIGYVSPDFRQHVLSHFFVPLFAAHDHQQFEIIAYSYVASPDTVTERLRASTDEWRTVTGVPDEAVADQIRRDRIDILVDLAMHMACGSPPLFARKPAPVQVCWAAYPGTTGLTTIDFRLTDPYLDPPGLFDRFYSEESIRLPDTFWCYDPLASQPAVNRLPALDRGHITFGSLNNFCKVNEAVLKLWTRVLNAVDGSRLLLLAPTGSHRDSTLRLFEQEGVATERITIVGRQAREAYLELYHQIDIGLDTFPYNGHTTSLDAYWMGVPVVTLVGQTVVGRAGFSQLTNLGLTELIAQTPDDFVGIAVGLANDLDRLNQLRGSLRQRMANSPLMDVSRFARNMEAAYRAMWRRWCQAGP